MAFATNASQGAFERLPREFKGAFPAIEKARAESNRVISELGKLANDTVPPDTSIVCFGSLARREWTSESDVDWTLLADGQADPAHRRAAADFRTKLQGAGYKPPGPTDVFGKVSFSHELIDCIGGERDTNANTTRRVLLLLESVSFSRVDAHMRVQRGLLDRYLDSERSFLTENGRKYKVPRFLLNDIVRYWRTVCVDYVNKQWERGDNSGWALRNVKLRFSRKLMFASGLLLCFSSHIDDVHPMEDLFKNEADAKKAVREHLAAKLNTPPIDLLCAQLSGQDKLARRLLGAYDGFLKRMNDASIRQEFGSLHPEASDTNARFRELRDLSREFQAGLTELFFDGSSKLADLTRRYGVF